LETDAGDRDLDTLLRLTERYCVVYQTLAAPAALSSSWSRTGANAAEPITPGESLQA
jgi:hypothetical protein